MKILHVINSLETGGAEKLLVDTLPLYAARGLNVDLLLLNGVRHPFLEELAQKNCCQIFSLGTSSLYHPKYIFKIIPFLRKYDLLHVHLFPAHYYVVLAKLFSGSKVKLILTEHNGSNRRLDNPWFRKLDKHIYKLFSKVICISPEIKNIMVRHSGLAAERFEVIENGVNVSQISNAERYDRENIHESLTNTDKVLIQIAAFREQKDQQTLIRSLKNLPQNYKLLLVGEGELKEKCMQLVVELGLEQRAFFLGVRMDIPQLLKSADIVVLSSRYEGLSLSSIEGMASGRSFIASAVPGLTELVKGAGILFPLGDDKKLAAEILHLCEDEVHYDKIVEQCLSRAQQYDISTMVAKHISLYEELTRE